MKGSLLLLSYHSHVRMTLRSARATRERILVVVVVVELSQSYEDEPQKR